VCLLYILNEQQAHQQTGLKNFPEAVRLYSIAIEYVHRNRNLLPSSPLPERRTIQIESENSTIFTPPMAQSPPGMGRTSPEKKLEPSEDEPRIDNTHTPLYVLYGCRSQAYQGMQQFALALKDAEASILCNPHHALAYAQKGKALYSLKRHKEALKCYEEGLKNADPNHAGLRRLVEILTQELQGTSITCSVSNSLDEIETSDKESQERQVEENFASDQRAERRKGEWEVMTCTGTELLRPRHAYAAALFSSQHAWYIFGGYADLGEHMGDFYRLYLFGGTSEDGYLEELHSFDLQNRTWSQIHPKEGELWPPKRWSHAMAYCPQRKKIYVFGGVSVSLSMLNDLWSFDIVTEKWTKVVPQSEVIPGPRHVHSLCLHQNNLYVYGGFGGRVNYHDFYRFDLTSQEWYLISDTVTGRRGHAAVVHEKWLYVFGGRGKNGNSASTFRCLLTTGEVEELQSLKRPTARHYISAALWGGSMWVFGGIGRNNYNDMFRYWLTSPHKSVLSSSTVGQDLSILVNNAQFCDVCFRLKNEQFAYGHRAILYARCEHFRGMFDSGMKESQSLDPIDLSHIEYAPFVQLLIWIYTGKIEEDVDGETVLQLLQLADQFLLPELRRLCAHVLRRFITEDNVSDLLSVAEVHNSPQLQIFCQQFLESL